MVYWQLSEGRQLVELSILRVWVLLYHIETVNYNSILCKLHILQLMFYVVLTGLYDMTHYTPAYLMKCLESDVMCSHQRY